MQRKLDQLQGKRTSQGFTETTQSKRLSKSIIGNIYLYIYIYIYIYIILLMYI